MVKYHGVKTVQHKNIIELEVAGKYAMFTGPEYRGVVRSLPVPTYEAVRGILRAVYWKPTFIWVADEVRVMNAIITERYPVNSRYRGKYEQERLKDVRYQIRAHFIWNDNRPEFTADRDEDKHFRIALRSISKGGRFPVYLGTAECPGEVRAVRFGSGEGAYDNSGVTDFGEMYHGVTYPDEGWDERTRSSVSRRYWHCTMNDGVIRFAPPGECRSVFVRNAEAKRFANKDTEGEVSAAGTQN